MLDSLFAAVVAVFIYMILWFVTSLIWKRNDVADVAWGGGFIVAVLASVTEVEGLTARAFFVTVLVIIWGLRLSLHIGLRNRAKGEDARYQKWREEWGKHVVLRSFFQIYGLQGVLLIIIALPVIWIITIPGTGITAFDCIGTVIWFMGFLFEAVADWQLRRFKLDASHKSQIITTGLWRFSRHPNYFGEVTLWWGIYIIALGVPGGWMTIIGPLTISVLIVKVSGIPMLEKKYEGNPEFEEYRRRTSAFFPLPPKP